MLYLVLIVISIAALWKLFAKAGKPGGGAIIPIYNQIVLIEMAGKPVWWFLLMFIPIVNIVVFILVLVGLAKNFGRGVGTVLGLIFLLILAFGSAEYQPGTPAVIDA